MTQYRYQLDPSSKKFHCPECSKKRFVKYIDNETGEYTDSHYGRCDRETSCRYNLNPMNSIVSYNYVAPTPIEPSYIDTENLQTSLTKYEKNPLVSYLYSHYPEAEVRFIIKKYQVGTSKQFNYSTVFWQIDHTGNIRSGKIMAYDTSTGKRLKDNNDKPLINWVHTALNLTNYRLKQCLFGLHLLKESVQRIAIVESEKTALYMSLELPQHTWMATGSLKGFKYEYLAPVINCEIIAFPDKGGYNEWDKTATALNKQGFNISVLNFLEEPQYEEGWDLIDVLQYESTNSLR